MNAIGIKSKLRPYATAGIALVGASVIAVTPIAVTPNDLRIANPSFELTANEIQNGVNDAIGAVAIPSISLGAQILAPLLVPILTELYPSATPAQIEALAAQQAAGLIVGFAGPLISGPGALGSGFQDLVDSLDTEDPAAILSALLGVPRTAIDGLVNGGYGPNLASAFGFPPLLVTILAGGLINPAGGPSPTVVPGVVPTLQGIVQLFGLLLDPPAATSSATLAVVADRPIETGVNDAIGALAGPLISVGAQLLVPLLVPVLTELYPTATPAQIEALAAGQAAGLIIGLAGPLISGPGALGTGFQDIVDSFDSENPTSVITALLGFPATAIDGVVNGGYGPDLSDALGYPSQLGPVVAGGLITPVPTSPSSPIVAPGTIPTLQGIVQLFGLLLDPPAVGATATQRQALAVEEDDPIADGIAALSRISAGFGDSGARLATVLGRTPGQLAATFEAVANGDVSPETAVRSLLAGTIANAVAVKDPAVRSLRENLPAPIGDTSPTKPGVIGQVDNAVNDAALDAINEIRPTGVFKQQQITGDTEKVAPTAKPKQRANLVTNVMTGGNLFRPGEKVSSSSGSGSSAERPRPLKDISDNIQKSFEKTLKGIEKAFHGNRDDNDGGGTSDNSADGDN